MEMAQMSGLLCLGYWMIIIREVDMNKDIELDQYLGFKEAGLNSYLCRCYASLRFANPTPIQYYSIHTYLTRNCSIVAQSKSGTGKTLSYVSIILSHILRSPTLGPTCNYLIVLPTRELALQVYQNFKEIVGTFTHVKPEEEEGTVRQRLKQIRLLMSIGGIPFEDDRKKYLTEGGNVVVGTIGRVLEMV
jgi:superfamily II DNA/RNA helicase